MIATKTINNLIVRSSQLDVDKDKTTIAEWMRSFPGDKLIEEFGEMLLENGDINENQYKMLEDMNAEYMGKIRCLNQLIKCSIASQLRM